MATGERDVAGIWRSGRLNWLQQNWLRGDPEDPSTAHENNLGRYVAVPECRLTELLAGLVSVVSRHESLRTIVAYDTAGHGVQTVHAPPHSVEDIAHILEVTAGSDGHEAARRRMNTAFDIRREWPVQFIVARDRGIARGVHIVIDHSATDGWGVEVLANDIISVLETASPSALQSRVNQPLDTVRWEDSADGAQRSKAVLTYWRRELQTLSDSVGGRPSGGWDPPAGATRDHLLQSARLRTAAFDAAANFKVSIESVFLCAFGWALTSIMETDATGILGLCFNRFNPADARSAALRITHAPVVVERPGAESAEAYVRRIYSRRRESMFVRHAPPGEVDAVVSDYFSETDFSHYCGASFNYVAMGANLKPAHEAIPSEPAPDMDEIVLKDPITERGPELRLTVSLNSSTADVYLTSDTASRVHSQGPELLRLIADHIFWMAASERRRTGLST